MEDPKGTGGRRQGDRFVIDWAGDVWTLDHGDGRFGLRSTASTWVHLALAGLTATGRRDAAAFQPSALVGVEVVHSRLVATFNPSGWHGLIVRAAWGLSRDGAGIDLEIQASASSVGALRRLEVLVETTPGEGAWTPDRPLIVQPRDRSAAGASYDGRESAATLGSLDTGPVHPPGIAFDPVRLIPFERGSFLSMGHPQDVARWMHSEGPAGVATRYALFGLDLEKGVVLRGRLREVRLPDAAPGHDRAAEEHRLFLTEPPPLRTE